MNHIIALIGFSLFTLIICIIEILLLKILRAHYWAYLLVGIIFISLVLNFYFKWIAGWHYIWIWISIIVLLLIILNTGRIRQDVSFSGNLTAGTLKFLTRDLSNSDSSSTNSQNNNYNWKTWTPPKGYSNKMYSVGAVKGYLLKKHAQQSNQHHIIYQIHGGGYINGFSKMYNKTALKYAQASKSSPVFSIDYRVAPKFKYPTALNDVIDGYHWLLNQGYQPKDIIIAGDSAGGGLALALTLKLQDNHQPLPKMLILSSPWTDLSAEGKSYRKNFHKDVIFGSNQPPTKETTNINIPYARKDQLTDPYVSPAFGNYKDMPPMLIQTGADEMLLSDSQTIARKVNQSGGQAQLITYPGMFHTFYVLAPWLPESKHAWSNIERFINNNI